MRFQHVIVRWVVTQSEVCPFKRIAVVSSSVNRIQADTISKTQPSRANFSPSVSTVVQVGFGRVSNSASSEQTKLLVQCSRAELWLRYLPNMPITENSGNQRESL